MKPAFHQDATIFGYADGELFAGPIQLLFGKVDHDAPATEGLHARIVGIDIVDTIAGVRLELDTGTATATLTCSRSSKSMERGRL
jgi:Putative lumazine-binding